MAAATIGLHPGETGSAIGDAEHLLAEWRESLTELEQQSDRAAESAMHKGWRWVDELEEIPLTFASAGLPDGFHLARRRDLRRGK